MPYYIFSPAREAGGKGPNLKYSDVLYLEYNKLAKQYGRSIRDLRFVCFHNVENTDLWAAIVAVFMQQRLLKTPRAPGPQPNPQAQSSKQKGKAPDPKGKGKAPLPSASNSRGQSSTQGGKPPKPELNLLPWPGNRFDINSPAGKIFLGTELGHTVAWLLIQHKVLLGGRRISHVSSTSSATVPGLCANIPFPAQINVFRNTHADNRDTAYPKPTVLFTLI